MTAYGVTPTGFVVKPQSVIVKEISDDILNTIASDVDLDPDQPLGQLVAIFAEKLFEIWQLGEICYESLDRGNAEDVQLDNIGSMIGVTREGESHSAVYCTAAFSVPGTYAAGALVAYLPSSPTVQWTNESAIVVPSTYLGVAVSPTNLYPATFQVFQAIAVGPDPANALNSANALAGGIPGSLSGMVPITGWSSVADTSAPTIGALEESDAAYAARQVTELSAPGACTLDSTAADIVQALANAPSPVTNVVVKMHENTTLLTDGGGLPGKSYEAVVFDGLSPFPQNDNIIAQAIWNDKPAGLQPFGSSSGVAIDSEGMPHVVPFSRPTQVPVYVVVTVAHDPSANPGDVRAAVGSAIQAASQGQPYAFAGTTITPASTAPATLVPGGDVIANAFRTVAQGQDGVTDVPAIYIGLAPNPINTGNLSLSPTQIGVITSVTVNASVFVP